MRDQARESCQKHSSEVFLKRGRLRTDATQISWNAADLTEPGLGKMFPASQPSRAYVEQGRCRAKITWGEGQRKRSPGNSLGEFSINLVDLCTGPLSLEYIPGH